MGRKDRQLVVGLFMIVIMVIVVTSLPVGYNMNISADFISLIPSLLLMVISVYSINSNRGGFVIGGFGMLGIGGALMIGQLNTLGVWIPDLVTANLTVINMKLLSVVGCLMLGILFAD